MANVPTQDLLKHQARDLVTAVRLKRTSECRALSENERTELDGALLRLGKLAGEEMIDVVIGSASRLAPVLTEWYGHSRAGKT